MSGDGMADVTRDTAGKVFSFVSAFVHLSDARNCWSVRTNLTSASPRGIVSTPQAHRI